MRSIAKPKSVRYSVSLIEFYKYSSSKCKLNKAFVYINNCNPAASKYIFEYMQSPIAFTNVTISQSNFYSWGNLM